MRKTISLLCTFLLLTSMFLFLYYSSIQGTSPTAMATQPGVWQLREMKWWVYPFLPDFRFYTPAPSILRIESDDYSLGGGYVFVQFKRTDLDGKKLQVRWNLYYTYPDSRDLGILAWYIFDKPLERTDMSDCMTEDIGSYPPHWNLSYAYLEGSHYAGPLGARAGWLGWRTETSEPLDLSSWTSGTVTFLLRSGDAWSGQSTIGDFDWVKVLDSDNNEVYSYDFEGAVKMELTGTYHDYGVFVAGPDLAEETTVQVVNAQDGTSDFNFSAPVGTVFTANITVTNATFLAAWQVNIAYDATLLNITDFDQLVFPKDNIFGSYVDVLPQVISNGMVFCAGGIQLGAPYDYVNMTGTGTLCQISFTIIKNSQASTELHLVLFGEDPIDTIIGNLNGERIPFIPIDGHYNYVTPPIVGDINGDGFTNIQDYVLVKLAVPSSPGSPKWNPNADINKDGAVNIEDYQIVKNNIFSPKP